MKPNFAALWGFAIETGGTTAPATAADEAPLVGAIDDPFGSRVDSADDIAKTSRLPVRFGEQFATHGARMG